MQSCGPQIQEPLDVWHYLRKTEKPIVLYGTGNGAEKMLSVFDYYGITASDIFVSTPFYRGQNFRGYDVLTYDAVCQKYSDCVVVLAFAVFRDDMMQFLRQIAVRYELLAPEIPVFGNDWFSMERLDEFQEEMHAVYSMLADNTSKNVFDSLLNYRISGKISYLTEAESPRAAVFQDIFHLSENEIFLDLGAYDGDTVREFFAVTKSRCKAVYALEPDEKNYSRLCAYFQSLNRTDLHPYNLASWSEPGILAFDGGGGRSSSLNTGKKQVQVTDLDSLLGEVPVSYVKMDVEGAEKETLAGMRGMLKTYRPKLAVSAYHRTEDLFRIPLWIREANPEYTFFLRHHPYIPAWESNYYCI